MIGSVVIKVKACSGETCWAAKLVFLSETGTTVLKSFDNLDWISVTEQEVSPFSI